MSIQNYGFKIDSQDYNLVNLIKGTQSFGFFNHLRFTWISFMSCFASQDDLDELTVFTTANKVLQAAANTIKHAGNAPDKIIVQTLNNCHLAPADKPGLQELSKALRTWSKSLPNNGQTATTERTPPLVPQSQAQAPRPPQANETSTLFRGEVRPKACSRAGNGNSCFVNTALQIILRTPSLLALFTSELQPRNGETTESESFILRLAVQMSGRVLLQQLSHPNIDNVGAGGRLRKFIDAINEMLKAENPQAQPFDIDAGDDAWLLLNTLGSYLPNGSPIMLGLTTRLLRPTETKPNEEKPLEKHIRSNGFPSVLCLSNALNHSKTLNKGEKVTEFISVYGITYQLQSVYNSTGDGKGSFGHATPSVRTSAGDFIVIDDIAGVRSRTKQQVLNDLGRPQGWRSAYYVKVSG